MPAHISAIIQAAELLKVYQTENLVLVDVSNGSNARTNYEDKHLDGALFIDLNTQLAYIKDDLSIGGIHPLPDIAHFSDVLTSLGISRKSHVVIYDDKNGTNAAARFWWMLRAVGHKKVQVLNGGFKEAERIGFPTNSKKMVPIPSETYQVERWGLPTADIFEVGKASEDGDHLAIDVRESKCFTGETEPIDLVAGHIPGAINVPFTRNLDEQDLFLPPIQFKAEYQKIFDRRQIRNIVVHCGSGVTACHTILAVAYAGLGMPKLYVGSWSEWSRNKRAVAKNV
ncbi:sulfurtransferase [Pontibacter toksunensis]|uniref:Sulfurtransferase n=1 Tax=Pontibacter toksunensis TaxID=1332631 RepID=A0ABW6C6I8_9BACT